MRLPGLDRRAPALLAVIAEAPDGAAATLGVAVDGGPSNGCGRARAAPGLGAAASARAPGARVTLRRADGAPPVRLGTPGGPREREPPPPWLAAALAFAPRPGYGVRCARGSERRPPSRWASSPARRSPSPSPRPCLWMTLPAPASLLRVALPARCWPPPACSRRGSRSPTPRRVLRRRGRRRVRLRGLGACVVPAVRGLVGHRILEGMDVAHGRRVGVLEVYGEPEPFGLGPFPATGCEGREPLPTLDQGLTIDYPPLTMMALRVLSAAARPGARRPLDGAETQNVVVKTLPVLGDVAAVSFLLIAFRRTPRRALGLAALYWALPPSWLSSAVLGFIDGASRAARRRPRCGWRAAGRAGRAGALLAVAALIKSTALLVAPAAAMALWAARAPRSPRGAGGPGGSGGRAGPVRDRRDGARGRGPGLPHLLPEDALRRLRQPLVDGRTRRGRRAATLDLPVRSSVSRLGWAVGPYRRSPCSRLPRLRRACAAPRARAARGRARRARRWCSPTASSPSASTRTIRTP